MFLSGRKCPLKKKVIWIKSRKQTSCRIYSSFNDSKPSSQIFDNILGSGLASIIEGANIIEDWVGIDNFFDFRAALNYGKKLFTPLARSISKS